MKAPSEKEEEIFWMYTVNAVLKCPVPNANAMLDNETPALKLFAPDPFPFLGYLFFFSLAIISSN